MAKKMMDAGIYAGNIIKAEAVGVGDNQTPAIQVEFNVLRIHDEHFAGRDGNGNATKWRPIEATKRTVTCWLTEKSIPWTKLHLTKCGYDGSLENFVAGGFDSKKWVVLQCQHGPDKNNIIREEWSIHLSDEERDSLLNRNREPMSSTQVMQFNQLLSAQDAPKEAAPAPAPSAAPTAAPAEDNAGTATPDVTDDLPFN